MLPPPWSLHVLVVCHTVLLASATLKLAPFHQVPSVPALSEDKATSTLLTPDVPSNAVPVIDVCVAFMYAPGSTTPALARSTS
ncbi:MAG: hypothetical protein KCHDKBKB_02387 [Elusimicrobia bacterium]|nr:hypothetical protein [Elusimicrobiota bacterium]